MPPKPQASPAPLRPIPREGIPGTAGAILHIFLLISALLVGAGVTLFQPSKALVFDLPTALTGTALFLLVSHLWRVTRKAKWIVPLLVSIGVFLTVYTHSLLPAAVLCGMVFTVSEGSLLIALQPKSKLALLPVIPLLGYGITLLLSRDPIASLSVLLPWPAAWALARGTRRSAESEEGPTRVGVICSTALTLGLTTAALLAIALFKSLGTLEPAVLMDAFEELRLSVILEWHSQPMPEGLSPELMEQWQFMTDYTSTELTVNTIINLLPGICTLSALIFSAACQVIQHAALCAFGQEASISDRVKAFEMSLLACAVFLFSFLAVILDLSTVSSFGVAVAQNLYLILLPGLALAGELRLTRSLSKKGPRAMGCLFYVIILGFCLLFFAPAVLALTEVIGHSVAFASEAFRSDDEDDPFGGS